MVFLMERRLLTGGRDFSGQMLVFIEIWKFPYSGTLGRIGGNDRSELRGISKATLDLLGFFFVPRP